ncbi:MAG: FHA domain-containing protein [Bauldia litoralis]
MRKGPDGKTIRPADEADDGATRKVPRKSIRDRIAGADEDADAVVTHIADTGADRSAGTPDDDETAIAGMPKAPPPPPLAATPVSPATAPAPSAKEPTQPVKEPVQPRAPGAGDVTQVYRPQRSEPEDPGSATVEMQEDGTVSDPVVGWLVVIEGPGRGSALPIGYGNNRLGRAPGEQICLDYGDEQISRENHAVVTYDGRHRKFYVQQGGGRNLTHVDDELVMVPVEVKGGETISLGRTKLRFVPFCGADFDWQDK